MALSTLDLDALRRWIVGARTDLAQFADRINALNVFPVPDADTGTNMLLTLDGALGSLTFTDPHDLAASARDLAEATLMAARGNSGVILSQLARGVAEVLCESEDQTVPPHQFALALRRASDYAWRSVSMPVDGTILTVAAAAADGAELANQDDLLAVVDGAVDSAKAALLQTREQLDSLERAGVVDAGGAGYLLVLESLQRVVHSDSSLVVTATEPPSWLELPASPPVGGVCDHAHDGPGYEVMYLLSDTDEDRVSDLRDALHRLGDSLVVAGGPDTWSVHVHVDDVAAALNAGVEAGRPHRFSVTRFEDELAARPPVAVAAQPTTAVVAVALADGLAELAKGEGRIVVAGDAGRIARSNASRAVRETGLQSVLLLADSSRAQTTADALAKTLQDKGLRVMRPGAHGPVEFLSALAVARSDQEPDDVIAAVDAALIDLSTASVRIAGDDVETAAGRAEKGEVVGYLDSEAVAHARESLPVAAELLRTLVAEHDPELVTLVTGEKTPSALADTLRTDLSRHHPDIEVTVVEGRIQELLAIGVE